MTRNNRQQYTWRVPDDAHEQDSPKQVTELCVNLDDATGEIVGDACEALLDAGALDVWTTPIQMKKQRPGVMLSVLCASTESDRFAKLMLQLTGSFGVRMRAWDRLVLDRRYVEAPTPLGEVKLKVGELGGQTLVVQPEFASVKSMAERTGLTVREAMNTAQAAARAWQQQHTTGGSA